MLPEADSADLRLRQLERSLGLFKILSAFAALLAIFSVAYMALEAQLQKGHGPGVLRVKGLIIEDSAGRERILIGAPVPTVQGRKRQDNTVGVVVIGENGADRLALGTPVPAPQIQGAVGQRIGNATGFVMNDENGDERGGFGVLDNDGRATFGLDYPGGRGEAITMGVLPGETSIQIHDSKTIIRASLLERGDSAPVLYGLNLLTPTKVDMGILRLSPYLVKRMVIKPNDEALNKALDDASR